MIVTCSYPVFTPQIFDKEQNGREKRSIIFYSAKIRAFLASGPCWLFILLELGSLTNKFSHRRRFQFPKGSFNPRSGPARVSRQHRLVHPTRRYRLGSQGGEGGWSQEEGYGNNSSSHHSHSNKGYKIQDLRSLGQPYIAKLMLPKIHISFSSLEITVLLVIDII